MINQIIQIVRRRSHIEVRRWSEWYARYYIKNNRALWSELSSYMEKSGSTGCSFIDYYVLYKRVKELKPTEVLECGTGVSTLVIAQALKENEQETGVKGRITSMEEVDEWANMAIDLLPDVYRDTVEIVVSPTVDDYFSLFRGARYRDLPDREYDFVFVDGPKYRSPNDGHPTFDFDYIHVLRNSTKPVSALIDQRVSTVLVFQQLLGLSRVRYSPVYGVGIVEPCTKDNLGELDKHLSSSNFIPSFRFFSKTRLFMHPINK